MVYKSIALALAASSLVAAQTFSLCDPTKGDKCPANPAFGECKKKVHEFDFTKVASGDGWAKDENFNKFWLPDAGVKVDNSPLSIDSTNGAVLTITKPEQAPLLKSKKYLFFGEVEVTVQAAPGAGIVTSIVLESDDRDEIDWEWVGGDQAGVQSNFFSKGANEYKNGRTHGIAFNPTAGLHTYKITWTADTITFAVDGAVIRTATSGEVENYKKWPQTPCQLKLGTWVGGKASLPKGTIDWAGGLADFNNAPFVAAYKSVKITDYCGGSSDSASSYEYTDASGDVTSIKVNGGSPIDDPKDASSTSSGTLKPTESKTSGGSSPTDGSKTNNSNNSGSSNTPAPDAPGAGAVTKMSSTLAGLVFLGYLILA